jgi:hypothetical protein
MPIGLAALRSRTATLRPIALGNHVQLAALVRAIAATRLEPVIDRVFASMTPVGPATGSGQPTFGEDQLIRPT